jgi:hypothetical protein
MRGRPFEPGNKLGRGRPRGSRNKKNQTAQRVIEEHAGPLARKAIVRALEGKGDGSMLKTLLSLVMPRRKDPPMKIGPLPTATIEELDQTTEKLVNLISAGKLSPDYASALLPLLEERRRVIEVRELVARVATLERMSEPKKAA